MAVSFRNIPGNLRVPLAYFEMDNSMAANATMLQKALLLGTVPATAQLQPNVPTFVRSADQVRGLTGPGSALSRQAHRWFLNNRSVPLYILAAAQTAAYTASVGSILWGGPATESGVIPLYIGGRPCRVIVANGADEETIAEAVVDAINDDTTLGVSAAVDGTDAEQTNITALQLGVLGNLRIDIALAGSVGGEQLPAGVTATITQMTGGAGSPNVSTLLSVVGAEPFDFVICPFVDAVNRRPTAVDLTALDEFFNDTTGRWSWAEMLYGHGFTAGQGTVAQLSLLGNSRNGQHVSIFGYSNSPTPPDEWLAAYVAQAAGSLTIDPARPVQSLPLLGVHPPPIEDRFTPQELQVLYFDGISSYQAWDDGTVTINRLITTYQRNMWGVPDPSYLDVETMFTAMYFNRFMRNRVLVKFPRHKLADDGTRFGAGQAIVTPAIIRAEMLASYGEMEELGLMENADGFEEALIVERNSQDPNRVDVLLPPDFVNQLRVFAALTQFRL